MAYEANNRHADCIALYEQLEKRHPSVSIRRQAADLRYILQAPKLKISQEEMVTIPLIGSSYDRYSFFFTRMSIANCCFVLSLQHVGASLKYMSWHQQSLILNLILPSYRALAA